MGLSGRGVGLSGFAPSQGRVAGGGTRPGHNLKTFPGRGGKGRGMVARRALAAAAVVAAVVAALAGASPAGAAPGALRVLLDGHLNVTGVDGNMTMSMNATADSGWADYTDDGSGDDGVSDGGDDGGEDVPDDAGEDGGGDDGGDDDGGDPSDGD